jgi:hypothetical protein
MKSSKSKDNATKKALEQNDGDVKRNFALGSGPIKLLAGSLVV